MVIVSGRAARCRARRVLLGFARCVVPAAAAAGIAACATVPHGTFDRTLAGETVEGRLSIRYSDLATQKGDASSGRFAWTAGVDAIELSLLDPLGQTVALVRSDARRSSITFRDGRRVDGDSPESLTQNALGWTVPLRGLRWWLDGRPDPGRPSSIDPDGTLHQDGWTVRWTRPPGGGPTPQDALPQRIDLAYPGPPAEVTMRLLVDQRSAAP